jgi:hypothetical protein
MLIHRVFRFMRSSLPLIFLVSCLVLAGAGRGQAQDISECDYSADDPAVDHAREQFYAVFYNCALMELEDFLADTDRAPSERAEAWRLISAIRYYQMLDAASEALQASVIEAGTEAFKAMPDWQGNFDITEGEYIDWMLRAKKQAMAELAAQPELSPDTTVVVADTGIQMVAVDTIRIDHARGSVWYKKWWAVASGVGLVATAAVLAFSGGGDDEVEPRDTLWLSDPPPPPGGKR